MISVVGRTYSMMWIAFLRVFFSQRLMSKSSTFGLRQRRNYLCAATRYLALDNVKMNMNKHDFHAHFLFACLIIDGVLRKRMRNNPKIPHNCYTIGTRYRDSIPFILFQRFVPFSSFFCRQRSFAPELPFFWFLRESFVLFWSCSSTTYYVNNFRLSSVSMHESHLNI